MRLLTFGEVGDFNVDEFVLFLGFEVFYGLVEDFSDGGFGTVDPCSEYADGLGVVVLGVYLGKRVWESGCNAIGFDGWRCSHESIGKCEVIYTRSHRSINAYTGR